MITLRHMAKIVAIAMMGICAIANAQSWPDDSAVASTSAEPVSLRLTPASTSVSSFSVEVQSRMSVQMLLVPRTTLMGLLTISGDCTIAPKDGKMSVQEFTAHVASMAYYSPGAPNREIPREKVSQTLLVSGLPVPDFPVRLTVNETGMIVRADGMPASYTKFYEVSLLHYPPGPVHVGESWTSSQTIPVCPDPDSDVVVCHAVATFSLLAADRAADSASIGFTTTLVNREAVITGAAKIDGTAEGKIDIRLSDGFPLRSENVSRTRLDFGGGNLIDMEQRITNSFAIPLLPAN